MRKKRTDSIEQRLLQSMGEAVAIARGKKKPSRSYALPLTARTATVVPTPTFTKDDIASIRRQLHLSQQVFADALNVSLGTVRSWEQGARVPEGPSVRLLELAQKHPAAVLGAVLLRPTGRSAYPEADAPDAKRRVSEGSDMRPPDYAHYRKSLAMSARAIKRSLERRRKK
ncbi:MAG: helix-turn-helix domain-containing protein [Gemmatimonadaceae bacterium]